MHWSLPLQIDKMPSPVSLNLEEENDHNSILLAIYFWFNMFTMYQDHGLRWIWFSKSIPSQVTSNFHKTCIRFDETLNYICYIVSEILTTTSSGLDTARWKQRVETWEGFPLLLLLPPLVKSSSTLSSVGDRLALSLHLAATLWKHWTWLSHFVKIALGHHTLIILHLARPNYLKTLCL